jgi:hypothetical protein
MLSRIDGQRRAPRGSTHHDAVEHDLEIAEIRIRHDKA